MTHLKIHNEKSVIDLRNLRINDFIHRIKVEEAEQREDGQELEFKLYNRGNLELED